MARVRSQIVFFRSVRLAIRTEAYTHLISTPAIRPLPERASVGLSVRKRGVQSADDQDEGLASVGDAPFVSSATGARLWAIQITAELGP